MKKTNLNLGWTLQQGEPPRFPMIQVETKPIDLPHDFVIESNVSQDCKNGASTGFFSGNTYSYTKKLDIPKDWEGKRIALYFDGVYGLCKTTVNNQTVHLHHYGYTPFYVDIAPYLYYGEENRITIIVSNDNEQHSRWYSGCGIYRDVTLLTSSPICIAPDGLYVYTDHIIRRDAFVTVEALVENHTAKDEVVTVSFEVPNTSAKGNARILVPAMSSATAHTTLRIDDVECWDIDYPKVYTLHASVLHNEENIDEDSTTFGVRTISVDSKYGFQLNGRTLNLKGGCLHHDNGILGAASFYDAEYRKLKKHKEAGFNAIRTSHNPPSTAFLKACDELGLLVIAEAFDVWHMSKNHNDFAQYFDAEWENELTAFIKRDRNHPSIVMWSIGNELPEQSGISHGYQTSAMLAQATRQLDNTRPVIGSLCSFFVGLDDKDTALFWKSAAEEMQKTGNTSNIDGEYGRSIWPTYTDAFSSTWDVVGYNYLACHYEKTGELFPNRVICATESKPGEIEPYWNAVKQYPYLIGDFVWTSMDYIGEAGIGKTMVADKANLQQAARRLPYAEYPWRTAGCGDFDLLGNDRPQLHYRRAVWGEDETYLFVHTPIQEDQVELIGRYGWPSGTHSWNLNCEKGTMVTVDVYTNAKQVSLFLNEKEIGTQEVEHCKATFVVPYEEGTLTAKTERLNDTLVSGGKPHSLRLSVEKENITENELSYISVEVVDENGNGIPWCEEEVNASIEGAGILQAFGSARGKTEENYTVGKGTLYQGRMMAIVKGSTEKGKTTLTVDCPSLHLSSSCELKIQ